MVQASEIKKAYREAVTETTTASGIPVKEVYTHEDISDIDHPKIGCQSGQTQNAKENRRRNIRLGNLNHAIRICDCVFLPGEDPGHQVAFFEIGMIGV